MHPLVVRRVVLLTKRCLEVIDAVQNTELPYHYCFLLSEHLAESTNRRYNIEAGSCTTIAHLQAKLNSMATLERCALLIRHPTTQRRVIETYSVVTNTYINTQ